MLYYQRYCKMRLEFKLGLSTGCRYFDSFGREDADKQLPGRNQLAEVGAVKCVPHLWCAVCVPTLVYFKIYLNDVAYMFVHIEINNTYI